MPGVLGRHAPSDLQRQDNDRHRPLIVLLVLIFLSLQAYLFTHVFDLAGIPDPEHVLSRCGISLPHVLDSDGNLDSNVAITLTQRLKSSDQERLVFYIVLLAAFLSSYFLPLAYKRPALLFWSLAGVMVLYGLRGTAGLLFCHLLVYMVLHPVSGTRNAYAAVLGLLFYIAFRPWEADLAAHAIMGAHAACAAVLVYGRLLVPLLRLRQVGSAIRTAAVHSPLLVVCTSAAVEGASGVTWALPTGLLLFFWHWERLIMYYVDYKDGQVPHSVSLLSYLSVFVSPGTVPNWNWGVTIGQGYDYCQRTWYCEDKNRLVLAGLRLWALALVYLVLGQCVVEAAAHCLAAVKIDAHDGYTRNLVRYFVSGGAVSTASVLATTMLDLFRWLMLWGSVVHFKVGVWRICGYDVAPYFDRPWLSTNLVTFWSRFTFHYREFLVRAFYYPVFFRFFKRWPQLRIFTATMAAACVANLLWGHVTERLYYRGLRWENMVYVLGCWPYFVLLGAGIAVTQIYLLRKKRRRRPWTWGPEIVKDILAAYCTLQFYALIKIFMRPCDGCTVWDLFRLFLIGFGVHL